MNMLFLLQAEPEATRVLRGLAEQEVVGDYTVFQLGLVVALIFAGYLLGKIASWVLRGVERRWNPHKPMLAIVLGALAAGLGLLGLLFGLKAAILVLEPEPRLANVLFDVVDVLIVAVIGYIVFKLADIPYRLYQRWSDTQESKLTDAVAPLIRTSLRAAVILLTLLQIAQVVSDQPLSSLVAGLGIGGLAFALAAQDSLKHLFGSVVIFTDRPFEVGDRLIIDGHDGPVEEVGFRSTRIRRLDGHLVTIPNGELVNKNIQNISKRPFIQKIMNITITYDTPPDKVLRAVEIVKDILHNHEGMKEEFPPRVFFNDFNATSLNIFVIYWYHPPSFWDFQAFNEKVNFEILRRYNEEGIEFAFPTQTVFLAGDANRPLNLDGVLASTRTGDPEPEGLEDLEPEGESGGNGH